MDLGSILTFLECKSILVTGATGFIAKSMYELVVCYISDDFVLCFLDVHD